jgi:hypothetical protein
VADFTEAALALASFASLDCFFPPSVPLLSEPELGRGTISSFGGVGGGSSESTSSSFELLLYLSLSRYDLDWKSGMSGIDSMGGFASPEGGLDDNVRVPVESGEGGAS